MTRHFFSHQNIDGTVAIIDDDGVELCVVVKGYRQYSAIEVANIIVETNRFLRIRNVNEDY